MTTPIPPIEGKTTVNISRDRAFALFTGSFGSWWPRQYHIGSAEVADVILEPREGGRWFERGVDGSECDWGRVLAWEPLDRVVFTWQIGGDWQFDPDPSHASEIEVRFHADGPEQTTIEVEQRHFNTGYSTTLPCVIAKLFELTEYQINVTRILTDDTIL